MLNNNSNDSNEETKSFAKANLALFLFYVTIGSFLAGTIEVLSVIIPFHLIALLITGFFALIFGKSIGQSLGYLILFVLLFAIVGFSICAGSLSSSIH